MSNSVEASEKAIIDLTQNMNNCIKKINSYGEMLLSQLKILAATFQDDGYDTIQGYIAKTQTRVSDTVPDLQIVMEHLIEYAELIRASRASV